MKNIFSKNHAKHFAFGAVLLAFAGFLSFVLATGNFGFTAFFFGTDNTPADDSDAHIYIQNMFGDSGTGGVIQVLLDSNGSPVDDYRLRVVFDTGVLTLDSVELPVVTNTAMYWQDVGTQTGAGYVDFGAYKTASPSAQNLAAGRGIVLANLYFTATGAVSNTGALTPDINSWFYKIKYNGNHIILKNGQNALTGALLTEGVFTTTGATTGTASTTTTAGWTLLAASDTAIAVAWDPIVIANSSGGWVRHEVFLSGGSLSYADGVQAETSNLYTFVNSGIVASTVYTFKVVAYDVNNLSGSVSFDVSSTSGGAGGIIGDVWADSNSYTAVSCGDVGSGSCTPANLDEYRKRVCVFVGSGSITNCAEVQNKIDPDGLVTINDSNRIYLFIKQGGEAGGGAVYPIK